MSEVAVILRTENPEGITIGDLRALFNHASDLRFPDSTIVRFGRVHEDVMHTARVVEAGCPE